MNKTLKNLVTAGFGLAAVAEEKGQKLLKEVMKKGAVPEAKARKMYKDFAAKAKKRQAEVAKTAEAELTKALKKLHLATVEDLAALEKKLKAKKAGKRK